LALTNLARIGDRGSVPLFIEVLQQGTDRNLRLHAINGLVASGSREAIQPLVATLGNSKGGLPVGAARGLADIGTAVALVPLRRAIRRTRRPFHRARLQLVLDRLEEHLAVP
jgi:HEAT repeat protein